MKVGTKFGRLTFVHFSESGRELFCVCTCGNKGFYNKHKLIAGHTQSCGCLQKERTSEAKTTHGKSNTVEYKAWSSMKERCFNPKSDDDNRQYKSRGITVCERWKDSFENFYEDMGDKPSDSYSLDRKDNNGNYEPSNCHWASAKEQAQNRRSNRRLTYNGETLTIGEMAKKYKINRTTLHYRLERGWSLDESLNVKPDPHPVRM